MSDRMSFCAAYGCTNRTSRKSAKQKEKPKVSFHVFPRDDDRRKLWIEACQRQEWELPQRSVLCSEHFEPDQFDRSSNRVIRLKPDAVPTLFNFPQYLKKGKCNAINNELPLETVMVKMKTEPSLELLTNKNDLSRNAEVVKSEPSEEPVEGKKLISDVTSKVVKVKYELEVAEEMLYDFMTVKLESDCTEESSLSGNPHEKNPDVQNSENSRSCESSIIHEITDKQNRTDKNFQNIMEDEECRYLCPVCSENFMIREHLIMHILFHVSENSFNCPVCQDSFSDADVLKQHLPVHIRKKLYTCDECGATFTQPWKWNQHVVTHSALYCDICKICFDYKTDYDQHSCMQNISQSCVDNRRFSCDDCGKRFQLRHHLMRHQLIHTGECPYPCSMCPRAFSDKSSFRRHMRIHTGVKPYSCDMCGKSFRQKNNMEIHIRWHAHGQPYVCKICDRTFTKQILLDKHLLMHEYENAKKEQIKMVPEIL